MKKRIVAKIVGFEWNLLKPKFQKLLILVVFLSLNIFLYYRMVIKRMTYNINKEKMEKYNCSFISFVCQTILNGRMNYDRKQRKVNKIEILCSGDEVSLLLENMGVNNNENYFEDELYNGIQSIENLISDAKLFRVIKSLKPKQKQVLYYLSLVELTEQETAKILEISQQAVSKVKKQIIKYIGKELLK